MSKFTHFDEEGRARMVDITGKGSTHRVAIAKSAVKLSKQIYENIVEHKNKKGDVLGVAEIAGMMGAKQTSTLIPMCHPLPISGVSIQFEWNSLQEGNCELIIEAEVKTYGKTGVEMEALTAVTTAALTVYDMCKAIDKGIVIGETYLVEKSGGKSGDYIRE